MKRVLKRWVVVAGVAAVCAGAFAGGAAEPPAGGTTATTAPGEFAGKAVLAWVRGTGAAGSAASPQILIDASFRERGDTTFLVGTVAEGFGSKISGRQAWLNVADIPIFVVYDSLDLLRKDHAKNPQPKGAAPLGGL